MRDASWRPAAEDGPILQINSLMPAITFATAARNFACRLFPHSATRQCPNYWPDGKSPGKRGQKGDVSSKRLPEPWQSLCSGIAKRMVAVLFSVIKPKKLKNQSMVLLFGPMGMILRRLPCFLHWAVRLLQDSGARLAAFPLPKPLAIASIPPAPALVPLLWQQEEQKKFASLAGIGFSGSIAAHEDDKGEKLVEFADDILFTHKGLSGPAILNASLYWRRNMPLKMDCLPGRNFEAMLDAGESSIKRRDPCSRSICPKSL